jgi:PAS domain S-box-containing protein
MSKILIVDDLPAMSQLIATLLSEENYHLDFANSGAEALEKAAALGPDLILLDIMMPGMDGFAVCRALRSMPRLAAIPIIMVTALDDRASRLAGLEAGADDFVSKPFDPSELRARVRAVTRMNRYRRLVAEQARYERLVNLSPDGIIILDRAGRVRLANPALLWLLGAEEADVLDQPIETFIAPDSRQDCRRNLAPDGDGANQKRMRSRFVRRDGAVFPVEINAGRFEWEGEPMVQAIVRDITERQQFEEALHLRNQELAMLNRASQRFVSILDLHQVLNAVLEEVSALFDAVNAAVWLEDTTGSELVCWRAVGAGNDSMQGLRIPTDAGLVGCAYTTAQTILVADAQTDARFIPYARDPAALVLRSILSVPFVAQGNAFGVLQLTDAIPDRFVAGDVRLVEALSGIAAIATENALLFRAVNIQRSQLRALAGRLAEVQEQEQQQLARELHDQIGQTLTVINLSLDLIGQMMPADVSPDIRRHLSDASELTGQVIRQVRTVLAELRPPVLDDYGLLVALQWYGQQFSQRTGIIVDVAGSGADMRCLPTVETALFRITQEALNNVAKHALASRVNVALHCENGRVRLAIADDGKGFLVTQVRQIADEPHWGFLTMQERALAVGGTLQVSSQPGAGTMVVVEVAS